VPNLQADEAITTLAVRIATSGGIFTGTSRDVWLDLGPKAWKLGGGFEGGSVRLINLPPSSVGPDAGVSGPDVPLTLADIKFVRVEKKGIGLEDLPPASPEMAAVRASSIAHNIGGLTNAPDSVEEVLTPQLITPQAQLTSLKASLVTAQLSLRQEQAILAQLQQSLQKANSDLTSAESKLETAEERVADLLKRGVEITAQITTAQNRLADPAFKFALRNVCHNETIKKSGCIVAVVFGDPGACLVKQAVCHEEKVVTDAWNLLNNTLPGLQSSLAKNAADLSVAQQQATLISSQRLALLASRTSLTAQLAIEQATVTAQLAVVDQAQSVSEEMDNFVTKVLPTLPVDNIPKPGQWVPQSLTVIVNGSDFVTCTVGERLKMGRPSWTGVIGTVSPQEQFLYGLRVNINADSSPFDRLSSGISTYFKVNNVSGWEAGPISKATVVGILKHEPSPGADGFVSLDLELVSAQGEGGEVILDTHHGVPHNRFIRVEYLHRSDSGQDDSRYQSWHVGDWFQVAGPVKRDTDRITFYEIHPARPKDIRQIH
jgi:hypothetical protein